MKNFLRYIVLSGIFLVPFVPLIVSGNLFFPFITGKAFAYRIIIEIVVGAWVLLAFLDRAYRPRYTHILSAVGAFLLIVLMADILSENPQKSFWSNFERMEGFVAIAHHVLFFLVLSSMLTTERLWRRFFATSIGASAIIAVYGMFQLAGAIAINQGGMRLDGTFGNATYLAGYMLFHIFLALFLILRWYGRERRHGSAFDGALPVLTALLAFVVFAAAWLISVKTGFLGAKMVWANLFVLAVVPAGYLFWKGHSFAVPLLLSLAVFLESFALYFTATRGALLGLIGGLLLSALLVALFERRNRPLRATAIGLIAFIVVLASSFYMARGTAFVRDNLILQRFANITWETAKSRRLIWGMAWEGVKERPLLGWGQESFNYVFNKHFVPELYTEEQWFDRTHNVILDWWIAAGFLGLLSYLSLYILILYYLLRGKEGREEALSVSEKAVLTGLLSAYFFHNFFVFDNIGSYIVFFSFLGFIHTRYSRPIRKFDEAPEAGEDAVLRAGLPAVIVVLAFSLYFVNVRHYVVGQTLIQAIRTQPKGLSENIRYFKRALSYGTSGDQEVREQLIQAAARVSSIRGNSAEKSELLALAEQEMKKQFQKTPNDARQYIFQSVFLARQGRYDEALATAKKALELSPRKQAILFDVGAAYLGKGETKKALESFKIAFDLATSSKEARIIYAVGAVYDKNLPLAKEILVPAFNTIELDDDRIVKAFYENGYFTEVLHIWQKRVEVEPANYQKRVSLAAAYYAAGDRTNSIKQLEEAIRLESKFKEQGEGLIRELRSGRNI